jgi:predicted signal transduction protein with EAL and GGDEF domain
MKVGEKDVIYNYDTMYSSPWATHIDFEARHRKITEVKYLTVSMPSLLKLECRIRTIEIKIGKNN